MIFGQCETALAAIAEGTEGDGFSCNIRSKSGAEWYDCVLRWTANSGLASDVLTLERDDFPPAYIAPEDVETIELCRTFAPLGR